MADTVKAILYWCVFTEHNFDVNNLNAHNSYFILFIRKISKFQMRFASGNNEMRKKIEDYSYGLTDLIGKGFSSSVFKGIN